LNNAVGGSKTSAHTTGYAADLVPVNGKMTEFKTFVKEWLKDKKFDQYINEFSGSTEWVHIGLKNISGKQRKQYLMYKGGKYSTIK
jgi:putative chitinase